MKLIKRINLAQICGSLFLGSLLLLTACDRGLKSEGSQANNYNKAKVKKAVDPERALKARVDAGLKNLEAGDSQRAMFHLNKAMEWNNKSAEVHNAFALLYRYQGDVEQEEKHYKLAVKYDSKDSKVRHNYGSFLCTHERYNEGIKQLQMAANNYQYGNRVQSFENLGLCAKKKGDSEAAAAAFQRIYRIDQKRPVTVLNLAILEYEQGHNQKAYQFFKRYLGLSRHTSESLWLGIRLERVFGDKNALASYELALRRLFPGSKEYQLYQSSLGQLGD